MKMLPIILIISFMSILLVGAVFFTSDDESFSISQLNPIAFLGKLAQSIGIGPGDFNTKIEFGITKGGDEELLDIWTDRINRTSMIVHIDFTHVPGQSYEDTKAEYHRRVTEAGRDIQFVPVVKTKKPSEFEVSDNYIDLTNANSFTITYDKLREGYEIRIGWGSVIASSTASSLATEPTMIDKFCTDSKGNYHIAYISPGSMGGTDVMYANSTDKGFTWTNKTIQEGGFAFTEYDQAGIMCNSTDTIFVTYSGDEGFGIKQAYMKDSSDNFATPTTIIDFSMLFSPGDLDRYSCAINSDSSVHCCGIDDVNNDVLYYVNSSNYNTLYGPFTSGSDDSDQCDIELSAGNNEVFIVASGTDQDDLDIFSSRDGFARHQVYDGSIIPSIGREPSIAITPDNDIWIAFGDAGDLQLCNGTNNSLTSWSCQEVDASPSFYIDVALNNRNDIILTYQTSVSNCAGTLVYALSKDNGVTWEKNRTQLSDRDNACYVALPYSQYPTSNRIYNNVPYIYTSNSTGTFYVYADNVTIVNPPNIKFTIPTAINGTTTSNKSVTINISIDNAPTINELTFNWNGSNFTIYNDSLIAMFNFNNVSAIGDSTTTTADLSLKSNNGTCQGNVTTQDCEWDTSGKYGGSLKFNGLNSSVNLTTTGYDNETGSVSMWVKLTDQHLANSDNNFFFDIENPRMAFYVDDTNQKLTLFPVSGEFFGTDASGWAGEYHHVAFTFDFINDEYKIYSDGILNVTSGTARTSGSTISPNMFIGSRFKQIINNFPTNGSIDDVRIWNRVLSEQEMYQVYSDNLRKLNETSWTYYINESNNKTDDLHDGKYDYSAYVKNEYDDAPNSNTTDTREITIDTLAPAVTINQPQNQTYNTTSIDFNVTSIDGGGTNSCVYSLNAGLNNNSMTNIGNEWNASNTSMSQGSHTANFYCVDNGGLLNNSEQVTFFIDTLAPDIFFTLPTPGNDTTSPNTSIEFNVSIVESDLAEVKWNWNGSNFTIYNDSLLLMFNLNNVSALGESDASDNVTDVSKYGNDGRCYNFTSGCGWNASGRYGSDIDFDGIDDSVIVSPPGVLNDIQQLTATLWVKPSSEGHAFGRDIITKYYQDSQPYASWGIDYVNISGSESKFRFIIDEAGFVTNTSEVHNPGEWYFLALSISTSELKGYVNGVQESSLSRSNSMRYNSEGLYLGDYGGSTFKSFFNGSIDEVRIYNYSLSADEINQLYMTNLRKINETQWDLYMNQSGLSGTYTYFSSAKDKLGNENKTDTRTINIQADAGPTIDIVFPTNNTNSSDTQLDVNYTTSDDLGMDTCWYSNDTYSVNTTLPNCNNLTGVTWSEGQHNVTIYGNDTGGNEAQDSVTFTIDSISPDISIVFPTNNTNSSNNGLDVNYTISDVNLDSCWYSNDTYSVNTTLPNCNNLTGVTWSEGNHNVTIYANDTFGNQNQSSVSFNIHTIPPSFDNLPASQTIFNNQSLSYDVDATAVGVALGTFGINWTSTFSINPTSGLLTNVSILAIANYSINVSINDSVGNTNYSIFSLEVLNSTIPESDAPTFDNLQNFTQVANISFEFDLDASDPSGIDTFVLNDTSYFSVNSTGTITNNTALSQDLLHWLKVIVNDTLGNFATGEFYINITPEIPAPALNISKVAKIYPSVENEVPYIKINEELLFP